MDDPFFARAEKKFYSERTSPGVAKIVKVLKHQTGHTTIPVDRKITAIQPGKRISKTGHIYWESRKNRSDVVPKNKI